MLVGEHSWSLPGVPSLPDRTDRIVDIVRDQVEEILMRNTAGHDSNDGGLAMTATIVAAAMTTNNFKVWVKLEYPAL